VSTHRKTRLNSSGISSSSSGADIPRPDPPSGLAEVTAGSAPEFRELFKEGDGVAALLDAGVADRAGVLAPEIPPGVPGPGEEKPLSEITELRPAGPGDARDLVDEGVRSSEGPSGVSGSTGAAGVGSSSNKYFDNSKGFKGFASSGVRTGFAENIPGSPAEYLPERTDGGEMGSYPEKFAPRYPPSLLSFFLSKS
jgi:hypothetical protein